MACQTVCRLCNRLIISTDVTFTDGTGLIITIPAGSYNDGEKYCIVVAQTIPTDTTITAPVFIQIGDGEELYPLDRCDCSQATACNIRTRTRYSTRVVTDATTGTFRLLGRTCCAPNNDLTSINGTAPVTEASNG
ncbi:MAG: hypothetical protein J6T10_22780 [Methanobrevibacter sp.]|nr:hypothetical protein [Methanobrevibacter sp.]